MSQLEWKKPSSARNLLPDTKQVLDKASIHVNNPETNKREPVFLVIWSRDTRMKYTYSSSKKKMNINSESGLKYKGSFHSRLEGHAANVTKATL